jgi:serine/threonine protein kinase, bacterial
MLYCPQGHKNPPGNRFCQVCGQEIQQPVTEKLGIEASLLQKLLGDRYRVIKQLGQGGFGRTYLAEDINRFNELCVLKEFAPKLQGASALKKAEELFKREAGVMHKLEHPQIPRFREICRCQVGSETGLFLVQDYVAGQTYRDLLTDRQSRGYRFSEAEGMELLRQILPVLDYIHSQGVIHRDISPDNLILRSSDQLPILIDFGGVKQVAAKAEQSGNESNESSSGSSENHRPTPQKTPQLITRIGKLGYAPEEQMVLGVVHPHSDLYSLAVTVLVLLTGKEPSALFDTHQMCWAWEQFVSLSPRLTLVLNKMLSRPQGDRFQSAKEVLQALGFWAGPTPTPAVMSAKLPANQSNSPTELPPELKAASGGAASGSPHLDPGKSTAVSLPPRLPDTELTGFPGSQMYSNSSSTTLKPSFSQRFWGFWGKILLLLLVGFGAGHAGWGVANYWLQSRGVQNPSNESKLFESDEAKSSEFANKTEAELKTELQERRKALGINNQFFMRLVDQVFYLQYPEQENKTLTMKPEDEIWRSRWHIVGIELLVNLASLSEPARNKLGKYKTSDLNKWQAILAQSNLNSSALFEETDAKFFAWFPNLQYEDFINQPIGQVWYAIAFDRFTDLQNQGQ